MTSKATHPSGFSLLFPVQNPLSGSRFCIFLAMVLALGLAGLASGCGKKAEEPATPPAAAVQEPPGPAPGPRVAQQPAQPRTLEVQEGAGADAVLEQMNRELLRWIVAHRRKPASFEEFISSARLTVPPPPAGKRYVLGSNMKIVLK